MTSRRAAAPLAALLALGAALPGAAAAYVGPGAGVSLFGSLVGLLAAVGTAIGFILLWPIRALLRKRRKRAGGADAPGAPGQP